jgi:hypothetical protein
MRGSELPVPLAALLCGVLSAAAAAQGIAPGSFLASGEASRSPAIAANTGGQEQPGLPLKSAGTRQGAPLAGNPLWRIPISELSETSARPLFSSSRRPPAAPALAALQSQPVKLGPPPKAEPDHPLLTLLGTIIGESVQIGVFADEASHDVIRLKAGDVHDGWTLRAVVGRAATFEKEGSLAATLVLPPPDAEATALSGHATSRGPTGGNGRMSVAPPVSNFVPANSEGGSRRPPKEG